MTTNPNLRAGSRRYAAVGLALLATVAASVQTGGAHSYWPPKPTVTNLPPLKVDDGTGTIRHVYRVRVKFYLDPPPLAQHAFDYTEFSTMGLNWCKAKEVLPAGWNTQDDRRLRTGSMCQEPPYYGSLGLDHQHGHPKFGHREWHTTARYSFSDGRYVFSLNGWTQGVHHAGGNHTTLHLIDVDVDEVSPGE